jgi:hypothetical protein
MIIKITINALLVINFIQLLVLAVLFYNFSLVSIGYTNFIFIVRGIITLIYIRPFSNFIIIRAIKKNHRIYKLEMAIENRLYTCTR